MKLKLNKYAKTIILECLIIIIVIILIITSIAKIKQAKKQEIIEEPIQLQENTNVLDSADDLYIVDITDENIVQQEEVNNEEEKNNNKPVEENKPQYYIKVNYGAQVVNIYKKDENGNYTVPVKAMVCSTGTHTPTSGVYTIPGRWSWGLLQGNVYGQYVTKITGNILFHSVPYTQRDASSLEYWEYDKLGTAASLGCVRLKVEDAKWIYNNCSNGTKVEFYSDANPGPLGKPSAKKISNYPDYLRNWDPTDPNQSNPWHNYKENENTAIKNEITDNKDNTNSKNETTDKKENTTTKNETTEKTQNTVIKNETTNKTENTIIKNEINDKKENTVSKNETTNKTENTVSKNETTDKKDNTNSKNETANKTEN